MDFEKIIKIISRTITICFMSLIISVLYLESKNHIYSDGFDIWGRLGFRADKSIKEKSLYLSKTKPANIPDEVSWSNDVQNMTKEHVLGNPDADITVYEFSSFDCPACSAFHNRTLPDIKQSYVETEKVAFVFKDFPLRNVGLLASVLTKCIPENEYYNFVDFLMRNQQSFLQYQNGVEVLKNYAVHFGISIEEAEDCLNNEELLSRVNYLRRQASEKYEIKSTPTIVIENKEGKQVKIVGAKRFEEFQKILDSF